MMADVVQSWKSWIIKLKKARNAMLVQMTSVLHMQYKMQEKILGIITQQHKICWNTLGRKSTSDSTKGHMSSSFSLSCVYFYNKQGNLHDKTAGINCAVGNHSKEFV